MRVAILTSKQLPEKRTVSGRNRRMPELVTLTTHSALTSDVRSRTSSKVNKALDRALIWGRPGETTDIPTGRSSIDERIEIAHGNDLGVLHKQL